jgi:acyl-[acyl-carrier-protein] desaturase
MKGGKMAASNALRESVYRAYLEFFDVAERKRRWHPLNDIPWEKLDRSRIGEEDAIRVETFCGVELYVPDYTQNGFLLTRTSFGHAWFEANWGYEESKHGLVFREYLTRSGLRTEEEITRFEDKIFSKVWTLPFPTVRQMNAYGALQESATFLIYKAQREAAVKAGNEVLERIYYFVSRDEAAHLGFYRKVLQLEMEEDREGTIADLALVVSQFQMPGVKLIPDYEKRLAVEGVGISSEHFLLEGIFPLLKSLGTDRRELIQALRKSRSQAKTVEGSREAMAAASGG